MAEGPYAIAPVKTFTALPLAIVRVSLTVVVPSAKVTAPVVCSVRLLKVLPPVIVGVLPFNTTFPAPAVNTPPVLVRFPPTLNVVKLAGSAIKVPALFQFPPTVREFEPLTVSEAPVVMVTVLLNAAELITG